MFAILITNLYLRKHDGLLYLLNLRNIVETLAALPESFINSKSQFAVDILYNEKIRRDVSFSQI